MIKRHIYQELKDLARSYRVITITGPRQAGKSTLPQQAFSRVSVSGLNRRYCDLSEPTINGTRVLNFRSSAKALL